MASLTCASSTILASKAAVQPLQWSANFSTVRLPYAARASPIAAGNRVGIVQKKHNRFACRALGPGGSGVLTPELKSALDKFVAENKIVLFMKGTKMFPQCGFSNTCVQILNTMNVPYETVNILEDDRLRQGLKEYSSWPTFPQLYIDGEFFGGCDITIEAFQSGELKEVVEKALVS